MIKVFIPVKKSKVGKKNLARGFWQSDSGQVYYDYINVKDYTISTADFCGYNLFKNYLNTIKKGYNQEAIFYSKNNIGNIFYSDDKTEVLPHRIYQEILPSNLKKDIKEALKVYKGCTVYNILGKYFIEIFTTI